MHGRSPAVDAVRLVRALLVVGLLGLTVILVSFGIWMREGVDCNDDCSTAVEVAGALFLPALGVMLLAFAGAAVAAWAHRRRGGRRR